VSRNKSAETSILDSLLPCVRVYKDSKCLYVFGITSQDQMAESRQRINNMQFDGLICEWSYFFFLLFSTSLALCVAVVPHLYFSATLILSRV
jgi:hypothetical protein